MRIFQNCSVSGVYGRCRFLVDSIGTTTPVASACAQWCQAYILVTEILGILSIRFGGYVNTYHSKKFSAREQPF